jgi:hypothetical protein
LTVFSLTNSFSAISRLLSPWAINSRNLQFAFRDP